MILLKVCENGILQTNRLGEFHQIYSKGALGDKNEVIRFWPLYCCYMRTGLYHICGLPVLIVTTSVLCITDIVGCVEKNAHSLC